MKKNIVSTGILLTFFAFFSGAQNVGINTTGAAPDAGAGLDVNFNNKGVLIPRVNIVDLNTIAPVVGSATESMLVYNTNTTSGVGYHYWDGSSWVRLVTNGEAWSLFGNGGTNAATNFLGTTDGTALRIRTNNINRFEYTTDGRLRSFNQGSAASPTYSWTGDVNTGIWRPGNDLLAFSTNGLERMRIDNNGSTGIGTTTPSTSAVGGIVQRLNVFSNTTPANGSVLEAINGSNNGLSGLIINLSTTTGFNTLEVGVEYNGNANLTAGVFGLARANAGTAVGVRGTSNSGTGIGLLGEYPGGTGWGILSIGRVGSTGGFFNVSDMKLKKDVSNISNALELVEQLNPVTYHFDNKKYASLALDEKLNFGFIAQEIEQIIPNIISEGSIPLNPKLKDFKSDNEVEYLSIKSVNYIQLIPILTKAIQEQQQVINSQEDKIEALERKVEEILSRLE